MDVMSEIDVATDCTDSLDVFFEPRAALPFGFLVEAY